MWIGRKRAEQQRVAQASTAAGAAPEPAAGQSPLAAAMLWLTTHLVEGFAAYGQAMYPVFTESGEFLDQSAQTRGAPLFQERQQMNEVLWIHAGNPWVQEHLLRSATPCAESLTAQFSSWEREYR
jgi:hypothetical protein